tara:strand:+ start:122 stop:2572 length:2451 start_codon:yes stop_codon:yes gene_type:complete
LLRALRSPAASSSRAGGATTTANVGAPRHPMKASDADPSRAAVAFRGITTKSPLEAELEQQRAVEEMERAQREMREEAARIASGRGATSASSSSAPSQQPSPSSPPKPKPAPPVFGAPLGGSVARTPSTPATEKPQPKRTVVKAPTLGIAMHSDGRVGPAGNRNLMPEPPPESADTSQSHLKDMLADGSFERYGVGGLDAEFLTIFRRVFASRMVPPEMVKRLGMRHVKGMLLYGPPGTGKTLVARQLGKLLNAHPPKIVNGPEILQRFVGQSEENMRELFAPAEKEWKGKAEKSKLHVIIFDEIDAIMKARGSGGATASVVHDNVVNQLLTKLDGMQSLDNVLVVGITNRRDLLDPAVLRPGRLELQVEVGLPDRKGRTQIFNIHTARMRAEGLLATDVDIDTLAEVTGNYSGAEIKGLVGAAQSHALARYLKDADDVGGDAPSASPSSGSSSSDLSSSRLNVTMDDFTRAMREVRPAMGADEEALASMRPLGVLCSCTTGSSEVSPHKRARDAIGPLLRAVARRRPRDDPNAANEGGSSSSGLRSRGVGAAGPDHLAILVHGPPGSGKSAAVAAAAQRGDGEDQEGDLLFPHVRVFRADVAAASGGDVEHALRTAFDDAVKSNLSLLVVDGLETLLGVAPGDAAPAGESRTASETARALLALLRRPPPPGRRLAVVATTSSPRALDALGLSSAFHASVEVPALSPVEVVNVLRACGAFAGSSSGDVVADPRGGGLIGHDAVLDPAARAAAFVRFSSDKSYENGGGVGVRTILRAVNLAWALADGGGEGAGGKRRGLDPDGDAWRTALARVGLLG